MKTVTPMMKQYLDVKAEYEGYVLMYRLGDFYECFFEDAVLASRELELTLTARDCGDGKRAAMCGVPFHKADQYVGRLVERGFKVAICEQVEDPKVATGLVRRDVTRVVTPGTITDNSLLNESKNNFLSALCFGNGSVSCAFADISTGEVSVTEIKADDDINILFNELSSYQPSEVIINVSEKESRGAVDFLRDKTAALVEPSSKRLFEYEKAREAVKRAFFDEYDKLGSPEMVMAVGALLQYIKETQMSEVSFVKDINVYSKGKYLELDINTRRNLELVEAMRTKEKRGSLLWVLDKTKTAMGARLMRSWIIRPLLNPALISRRQEAVGDLVKNRIHSEDIAEILSGVLDIERLTAKAVYGTANAKDLRAIYQSIVVLPAIKALISELKSESISAIARELDTLDDISGLLGDSIVDTPPFTVREGGMIRAGFDRDIDYYRSIRDNGEDIMRSIEQREKDATGIKTLKVAYNKVFGYYIEVSKSFIDEVPDRYIRKQTLTNCERYITQELKEMETTILGAEEKLVMLEFELFTKIRETVAANSDRIRKSASMIAELDVYRSFAEVASKNSYVCPEVDLGSDITIKDGRHPVVEKFVTDSFFVPNDTTLNTTTDRVMLITGPNMAGKSTYMRQVAIITIMAQIGSFVPAREAHIGIVDKVFTRVGASDDLASGQSTFMLEMNEVAAILKNATKRSLIIYDEVGRGTSTYDGMSIAKAVVEYTHSKKIGAKTLFATHYHELITMENELPGVVNYNIAAKKRGDSITFLRKIVRGGTDDSYGIEVAKLAGVPNEVVRRAKEILAEIEGGDRSAVPVAQKQESDGFDLFTGLIATKESEVAERLRSCDLNTITPIEAMNLLFELKKQLAE
ncbi:MAG: DNA mismatch repair protein MutS [Ruminococcaceae bacterium]|nr:DNA mismatch repair protein MutS [Oscillospiraceae bacterium]